MIERKIPKMSFIDKIGTIILILLFISLAILPFVLISFHYKKFECSKSSNKCRVVKLFDSKKTLAVYDLSKIAHASCYVRRNGRQGRSIPPNYVFYISFKPLADQPFSTYNVDILRKYPCKGESERFNKYLKSDAEKFVIKEYSFGDIKFVISALFFIWLAVYVMKEDLKHF